MGQRVCICCGEVMPERAMGFSGNPNVCAACLRMVDELEDSAAPPMPAPAEEPLTVLEQPDELANAA